MPESIPRSLRLKLERGLATWKHWHADPPLTEKPSLLEPLRTGRSNHSYLLRSGKQQYVLRIDGADPSALGLSRSAEQRAHIQASDQDLAPDLCWFNPELGISVTTWLPQQSPPADRRDELAAVATLLRDIHRLPPIKYRMQPMDRAKRYLALTGEAGRGLSPEFAEACQALSVSAAELRLCHNDLLRENRLWSGGRLYALDWEYAAMGHPLFDLAVICEGDGLDQAEADFLLEHWCGDHQMNSEVRERMHCARTVYRELTRLWEVLTGR